MSSLESKRWQLKSNVFLDVASDLSRLSTCARRSVGCVLVDIHGRIVGSGYNGVPSGFNHCSDPLHRCPGAGAVSGEDLDKCYAIHAEMNALAMCERPFELKACYSTVSPCIHCVKLLLNTSCQEIYFRIEYPHHHARSLWLAGSNRRWHHA